MFVVFAAPIIETTCHGDGMWIAASLGLGGKLEAGGDARALDLTCRRVLIVSSGWRVAELTTPPHEAADASTKLSIIVASDLKYYPICTAICYLKLFVIEISHY